MMKYTIYIIVAIACMISACTNATDAKRTAQLAQEKVEFDSLYNEVMKIHDDVMPETNNLYKLQKIVEENLEFIPDTSIYVKKLLDVKMNAVKADDLMMEWMADFKVPEDSHKHKMDYLNLQLTEIKEVRKSMLNTLHDGKNCVRNSDRYIRENKLK